MIKMNTRTSTIHLYSLYCIIVVAYAYEPKPFLVNTKYGPVIGSLEMSKHFKTFLSFRGIPYAKPPVDDLRFRAPEPPEPWTFAVDARKDAPFCIQKNYFFENPKVEGQEDCLYLNVYIPMTTENNVNAIVNNTRVYNASQTNSKQAKKATLLPVMVFIHWGGFLAGRGSSDIIGPDYIMDKDVILVTFNYRLGVFGFFSTLDDHAPGNFGLKDQVMALKFIQENIEYFGGDKNRITIFGQSAGAGSVSLHLISPLSKGLFQQAISQSGVALNLWAKPLNILQPNVTAALATFVGCASNLGNNAALLCCLRKTSAFDLANSADKFKYFATEPLTPYSVVTEQKSEANPNPFLTKEPLEYLQAGEFQKVPWIVGVTQNEGILRASLFLRNPEIYKALNANFNSLLPQMLFLPLSVGTDITSLFQNLTNYYLGGSASVNVNNSASVQGFIDLYSDRAFVYGTYQAVILQSQKGHKPIWLYNFDYRGQYSYGDKFAITDKDINFKWGVSHCDDLLYLFRTPALFPDLEKHSDLVMSENLVTLWTNFAIHGDPDPQEIIQWKSLKFSSIEEIKNENLRYLNITGSHNSEIKFEIQKGFYTDRMNFWIQQNVAENFPGLH